MKRIPWASIGTAIMRYGLVAFLLLYVIYAVTAYVVIGDAPTPQVPPDGYRTLQPRVRLTWSPGDVEPPFEITVARDGDFANPVHRSSTNSTSMNLPPLEPGKRYCWRISGSAAVSCFETAPHTIPF
jgi:hypothetical protein